MASTGDTDISLHIRSPRLRPLGEGGGYSGVKTENTQSAKKWLNFNFIGGGGGVLWSQNWKYSKCQEMAKFQFFGGEGFLVWNFQRGALWRIWTQILLSEECVHRPALASEIVSHTLRMWRLISNCGFQESKKLSAAVACRWLIELSY